MKTYAYLSHATHEENEASLRSLLVEAALYNASVGVTGLLAYTNRKFAQIIEGPDEGIHNVEARIRASKRHHTIVCIADCEIRQRLFPTWQMQWWLDDEPLVRAAVETPTGAVPEQLEAARRVARFLEWEHDSQGLVFAPCYF